MNEYESLREDIAGIFSAFDLHATVQRRFNDAVTVQHERLWTEVAELRDEVNAVANRLESLTHFVTADPAEVAAKIVNDANVTYVHKRPTDDSKWFECSECGVAVYRQQSTGKILDGAGLHTCHVHA